MTTKKYLYIPSSLFHVVKESITTQLLNVDEFIYERHLKLIISSHFNLWFQYILFTIFANKKCPHVCVLILEILSIHLIWY